MNKRAKFIYILRCLLVFLVLYLISSIVVDGLGFLVLWLRGYDVLHGDLPSGPLINLVPSYSFIGYALVFAIYLKYMAHETLAGFKMSINTKEIIKFLVSLLFGATLIGIMMAALVTLGSFTFDGFKSVSIPFMMLAFGAVFVRATTIEFMCRGYLQNVIGRKCTTAASSIISAFVFLIPSIAPLIGLSIPIMIMAVYNLFLVSIMYSLIMVKTNSMWVSAGIHVGWNYTMAVVLDLPMAGTDYYGGVINFAYSSKNTLLTGGRYGITASIVMSVIILIIDLFLVRDVLAKEEKLLLAAEQEN